MTDVDENTTVRRWSAYPPTSTDTAYETTPGGYEIYGPYANVKEGDIVQFPDGTQTQIGEQKGIWGPVPVEEIIGFTRRSTNDGIELYMPVTQKIDALNRAEARVKSFAPGLADRVRGAFDSLEHRACANPTGLLYRAGPAITNLMGVCAMAFLYIAGDKGVASYSTITPSDFFTKVEAQTAISTMPVVGYTHP
jgi:hypothetical protein